MVVERTTRNRYNAGRVGGRAPMGTSKKGKQQGDSSESSEADTKEEALVARTQRTLKGAELNLSNRDVLASTGVLGQQPQCL
jgi:hypothetical protein